MYDYIQFLADKWYIAGYPDNTFRPNNSITRTEFLKLLFLVKQVNLSSDESDNFLDVIGISWQKKYVNTAIELWIVSKINKRFYPNSYLTKVEALKMAVILYHGEIESLYSQELNDVWWSEWYAKYVQYALENNLLESINGYFYPTKNITRYEVIQLLHNISK